MKDYIKQLIVKKIKRCGCNRLFHNDMLCQMGHVVQVIDSIKQEKQKKHIGFK